MGQPVRVLDLLEKEQMILIIVESPTKARSIARYAREFFETDVVVRSCLGHLRDLPDSRLGVEVKNGFAPEYELMREKQKTVRALRPVIRQASRVLLAADPDREGEAVAWHMTKVFAEELKGKSVQRVVFHAITRESVHAGLRSPRMLDKDLVRAAVARRVADRLVGYIISPRVWQAVDGKNLSTGRVQSTTLGLLVAYEEAQNRAPAWAVDVEL